MANTHENNSLYDMFIMMKRQYINDFAKTAFRALYQLLYGHAIRREAISVIRFTFVQGKLDNIECSSNGLKRYTVKPVLSDHTKQYIFLAFETLAA